MARSQSLNAKPGVESNNSAKSVRAVTGVQPCRKKNTATVSSPAELWTLLKGMLVYSYLSQKPTHLPRYLKAEHGMYRKGTSRVWWGFKPREGS